MKNDNLESCMTIHEKQMEMFTRLSDFCVAEKGILVYDKFTR